MGGNHLYDCDHCEKNPYFFGVLGHDGPPAGMWTENLITDEPLAICPRRLLLKAPRETVREITTCETEVYPLYRKGFLLHPGSVGDQPARELAMFREFDRVADLSAAKLRQISDENGEAGE